HLAIRRSSAPRDHHPFPTRRSSDLGGTTPEPGYQSRLLSTPRSCRLWTAPRPVDSHLTAVGRALWGAQPTAVLIPCSLRSAITRSEEHTSELQSRFDLVCRLLLEKN